MSKLLMFGNTGRDVVVAGAVVITMLVAGCSDGGAGPRPSSSARGTQEAGTQGAREEALQVQRVELADGPARLELLSLGRRAGGKVVARFRLSSETALAQRYFRRAFKHLEDAEADIGGVSLVDVVGNKAYYPLRAKDGDCLCTALPRELPAGQTMDWYAVYPALPQELTRVTVRAPLTTPFHDVEVGEESTGAELPVDPETADLAEPVIRSLKNNAEGLEQSTDEEGDDKRIRISADVLFAIDKAVLNPAAQRILKEVAQDVDASSDDVVEVDGYTDDTGTTRHNQDLSERRAKAVVKALEGLVTREGVSFRAEGHGESDPVSSNKQEEGRRLNRRVAVAFTRPAPSRPPTPSAGSGSAGEAFVWSERPPVIGTLRPKAEDGADGTLRTVESLQYDVNNVHRDSAGLVSLVWTVTNKGDEEIRIGHSFGEWLIEKYEIEGTDGVALIDPAAKVRYGPIRDDADLCLCYQAFMAGNTVLAPGEQAVISSLYKLPAEVATVDVRIPFYSDSSTIPGLKVG